MNLAFFKCKFIVWEKNYEKIFFWRDGFGSMLDSAVYYAYRVSGKYTDGKPQSIHHGKRWQLFR